MKAADKYYEDRPEGFGEPRADFIAGAKFAAQPVQRLGEIIQKYAAKLPPPVINELREIFELNKEIVDAN